MKAMPDREPDDGSIKAPYPVGHVVRLVDKGPFTGLDDPEVNAPLRTEGVVTRQGTYTNAVILHEGVGRWVEHTIHPKRLVVVRPAR